MLNEAEKEARRDRYRASELITVNMSFEVPFGLLPVPNLIGEYRADQDLVLVGYDMDATILATGDWDAYMRQSLLALEISFFDTPYVLGTNVAMNTSLARAVARANERIDKTVMLPQPYNGKQLRRERSIYGLFATDLSNVVVGGVNLSGFALAGNINLFFAALEVAL